MSDNPVYNSLRPRPWAAVDTVTDLCISHLHRFYCISNMATASVAFRSREDHRKLLELEEARKAGLAPAEVDEDGKEINPHIPQYMSSAP